jgi:hypothetical protein
LLLENDDDESEAHLRASVRAKLRESSDTTDSLLRNKRTIVDKFDLKESLPEFDAKGNPMPGAKALIFVHKAGSQVRYRDSMAVTNRGDKYIVEQQMEYDGGSRGRVMPKGKRGPGWVGG